MKWIGQHIWDYISRFRNDVYLENLAETTQDHVVGVDSDGKLYKQDKSVGDITAVKLKDEAGTHVTTTAGQATIEIVGSAPISTSLNGSSILTISHDDTSSQASVDNSGRTYIQDITLDTYGHVTGLTSATETVTDTNTNQLTEFTLTGDSGSNQTIAHGNTLDIAGGDGIITVVGATDTVTINHDNTSSQASVDNSGSTFIQDVTLDTYGHVTGLTSTAVPTLNQDTTGNAATATALTSGDKILQGNLRIGGPSDTSNNWISIDAQSGNDSSGGGITFFETNTTDGSHSYNAPQYGAKIVYNETEDELAIGTMHNDVFMRQMHMDRGSKGTNFRFLGVLADSSDSTDGPYLYFQNLDTSVVDGQVLSRILVKDADRDAITSRINWVATENHDSNSGGTKIDFVITPNGNSQSETTAMTIDQDSSVTINGDLTVGGDITSSSSSSVFKSIDTTQNYVVALGGYDNGPRVDFGDTDGSVDEFMTIGAFSSINQIDTASRDFHLYGTNTTTGFYFDESAGTFGVGTSTPGEKLDVSGNIKLSGNIELGHASDTTISRVAAGYAQVEGETIVTTITPTIPSGGVGQPIATLACRRTLTTAECNALHTTPIGLIPAPGTNIVALPVGGMLRVDRLKNNVGGNVMNFHYEGLEPGSYGTDAILHLRRFHYNQSTDGVYNLAGAHPLSSLVANSLTEDVNKAIEVSFDIAATTDCFDSIDIYLTYQLIKIA